MSLNADSTIVLVQV